VFLEGPNVVVEGEDVGQDLAHLVVAVVACAASELAAGAAAVVAGKRTALLAGRRGSGGVLAVSRVPGRLMLAVEVLVASPADKEGVKALALALATCNVVLLVASSEPQERGVGAVAAVAAAASAPPSAPQLLNAAIALLPAELQLPRIAYLYPGPDPPHPLPHPGVVHVPNVSVHPGPAAAAPSTLAELLSREHLVDECLAGDAAGRILEAVFGPTEDDRQAKPMTVVKEWARAVRAQFEGIERAAMVKK
jgi:hypothetical protein